MFQAMADKNIANVLQKLIVPDTDAVKQGTKELSAILSKDQGVPQLCQVLGDISVQPELRQCAATMLRRHLLLDKKWRKLSPHTKRGLKEGVLQVVMIEVDSKVRLSVAALVAVIAKHEDWPECLQAIAAMIQSEHATQKQTAFQLLYILSRDCVQFLKPHLGQLLSKFDSSLSDLSLSVESVNDIISSLSELAEVAGTQHAALMQSVVRHALEVAQQHLNTLSYPPAYAVLSLLETLIIVEVPVLAADLPSAVQFSLQIATEKKLKEGLRVKAINFLSIVATYRKKHLLKHKLCPSIVLALFETLCESVTDGNPLGILMAEPTEEADDHPMDDLVQTAGHTLDTFARHLPPDRLLQPLMPAIEQALTSGNKFRVRGGYWALAVIAEGCSERLRTRHIDLLLQCVCSGVSNSEQIIRDGALLALAQFAEYLQPEISRYHQQVLPIVFTYLSQVCERCQHGESTPIGSSRLFYAIEVFCENMEQQDLVPYLQPLLQHVFAILQVVFDVQQSSTLLKKNAISVIGAVALSAKEYMVPFFEQIVSLLKVHLLPDFSSEATAEDASALQLQSLETLAQLTRSIGPVLMEKYASDICQLAQSLLGTAVEREEPELRKTCYRLFAALARVMQHQLLPHIEPVVSQMISSLTSTEGVVNVLKDESNKSTFHALGEESESEEEDEEQEDDDDADIGGYSVQNLFIQEKEDTCVALRELAECCGEGFVPHACRLSAALFKLTNYPHEEVRVAAVASMTQFVVLLSKSSTPQAINGFEHWVQALVAKISELVRCDDYAVVTAGLEGYAELLSGAGSRVLKHPGHLEAVLVCINDIFCKKTKCQRNEASSDDEDDDDSLSEAEMDEMLVESAGDIIPPLGKALGPVAFSQYFPKLQMLLTRRLKPHSTECVRSYVVGSLAECVEVLGVECGRFLTNILPVFMACAQDKESGEVRSNAIYGLGLLALHGGTTVETHLSAILQQLSQSIQFEKEARACDNVCGALARIMGAHAAAVDKTKYLPALLNYLPLKEDFEENVTVFTTLSALYQQRDPTLLQQMPLVLRAVTYVYGSPQSNPACQVVLNDFLRRVQAESHDQLLRTDPDLQVRLQEVIAAACSTSPGLTS